MNLNLTAILQIAIAIIAGVAVSYQPGINARFAQAAPHQIYGGVVNFAVGLCVMLLVTLVLRVPPPSLQKLGELPWWACW